MYNEENEEKEVNKFMSNRIFNYNDLADTAKVPQEIVVKLEEEARKEYPWDDMLMELHVLRAVSAYADDMKKAVAN
jgi:hypothetical protein